MRVVMATGPKNAYAGGLVGLVLNETTITHCYTTVNVGTGGLQKIRAMPEDCR